MTHMHETSPPARDRRSGLVLFGLISIVAGCFCALLAVITPLSLMAAKVPGAMGDREMPRIDLRSIVISGILYLGIAVLLIWAGVGSVRLRRWSRPVMLIIGWMWLLCGAMALFVWILMIPNLPAMIEADLPEAGQLDAGVIRAVSLIASALLVVIWILLPAAVVWFYHDRSVEATLDRVDPMPSWSDRCPLPVLGLSAGLAVGALISLSGLAYGVAPIFNVLLTGVPAAFVIIGMAAFLGWCAWATYRLRMSGWWGTMILSVLLLVSGMVTALTLDPGEVYARAGFPAEDVAAMKDLGAFNPIMSTIILALVGIGSIAYLFSIRRLFSRGRGGPVDTPPSRR